MNSLRLEPVFLSAQAYEHIRAQYPRLPSTAQASVTVRPPDLSVEDAELALHHASVLVGEDLDEESVLLQYKHSLTGHPDIHVCYLILTEECNLRCTYCFVQGSFTSRHRRGSMAPDVARRAVEFFQEATRRGGCSSNHQGSDHEYTLILYGGEPTLNQVALEAAVTSARSLDFPGKLQIAMVTNGTALTPVTVRLLKEHDVGVSVSLDGPAELTDSGRNKGTYAKACAGIEMLREAGINPGISCTLPPSAVSQFDRILAWLESMQVRNIGFNLVTRPASGYDSPEYHRMGTEQLIRGFKRFRQIGVYEDRMMRKVRSFVEHRVYPFDCAACGGAQIVVAPDGRVGICHAFLGSGKTFVGHVSDERFFPEKDPIWTEWSVRSPINIPECKNCECLGICGGGCPANNPDNLWVTEQGFCAHSRVILNWLIWDLLDQMQNPEGTRTRLRAGSNGGHVTDASEG